MLDNFFWIYDSVLDKNFCNYVLNCVEWDKAVLAKISTNPEAPQPEKRITNIVWQNNMTPIGCVLQQYINNANSYSGWNYDLTNFEDIQMSEYKESGHIDWHIDAKFPLNGIQRKLSCSILLNDPSEFEGGVLEIENADPINLKLGSIVVFPSFLKHRVTPITSGKRYTAVSWAIGPAFK